MKRLFRLWTLRTTARFLNCEFVDIEKDESVKKQMDERLTEFRRQPARNSAVDISKEYDNGKKISDIYDAEYTLDSAGNCNYGHVSALLTKAGLVKITALTPVNSKDKTYLDVGAGSNEWLRFLHDEFSVPVSQLTGCDLSGKSYEIIASDGCNAVRGTISAVPQTNRYAVILLSYFIDYDQNQKMTFGTAINLLEPGGLLLCECKLPYMPIYAALTDRTVTTGLSAATDVYEISKYMTDYAKKNGRSIRLIRIADGYRWVRSRFGIKKLTSTILVFQKN